MPDEINRPWRVLIVDDEPALRAAVSRLLSRGGYDSVAVESASQALEEIERQLPDLVVSDISMPGASGIDLLRAMRGRDLDLPLIFLTGSPTVQTAARALELGAFRYLTKPFDNEELLRAVEDAVRTRALAKAHGTLGGRAQLERAFLRSLEGIWMAFQPLVSTASREPIGYEALLRSKEPALPSPIAVLDAAEKLGTLHMLGQMLRTRVAEVIEKAPPGPLFFVNVHVADLTDADLFDPRSPLSLHASRVVLELTERASLEGVADIEDRIARLRSLGYRIAVDDLGAGYAGLSYFASVKPEVVKIDISLVRNVDRDPVRRQVVSSLVTLATSLGIEVVAEGIETTPERDTLIELGCHHLQGYALARPGPPFPTVSWH